MSTRTLALLCAVFALASSGVCLAHGAPAASLAAYRSEAEFQRALTRWRDEAVKLQGALRRQGMLEAPAAAPVQSAAAAKPDEKVADALGQSESITNVQTAGVDEGGIVKRAGDHLVILRRGRLFTVRVTGDSLQPSSVLDAYAPGSNPVGAWYDELLVSGQTVVVVGYSYARGGTEIGLFELGGDGALAYRATYHLRSFDYYSSRNYASRLVGTKLVFYTPTLLQPWAPRPWENLPALRRWQGEAAPPDFERILPATRIYRTDDDFDPREALALHTVTSCDLEAQPLHCDSSAVLGPAGRVFYVSSGSVYVWTSPWQRRVAPIAPGAGARDPIAARSLSAVFRIPLDGAAPSAIKTAGVPIDQMSFLEENGHLDVLLREAGNGESMWGSESTQGAMALLRLPLSAFGDGRDAAQRENYRALPAPADGEVQNRFVGEWLLWGGNRAVATARADRPAPPVAWALRYADRSAPQALAAGHGVERIEAMGRQAVLVGNLGADLHFSIVRLSRDTAELSGGLVQPGARQGETRSHGFFFKPTGNDEGLLGLPVLEPNRRNNHGVFAGAQGSASVLFLRQRGAAFSVLGRLQARADRARDDGCKASCVDWYGNARPIFLGDRVFALLGYELVEGRVGGDPRSEHIDERRRISFAPAAPGSERYSPFQ